MDEPTVPALSDARRNASASRIKPRRWLLILGDRKPADERATDERIARDVLPSRVRQLPLRDRGSTERVIAEYSIRLGIPAQHEHGFCLPSDILPGLGFEIAIETFDTTSEAAPVVRVVQGLRSEVLRMWYSAFTA